MKKLSVLSLSFLFIFLFSTLVSLHPGSTSQLHHGSKIIFTSDESEKPLLIKHTGHYTAFLFKSCLLFIFIVLIYLSLYRNPLFTINKKNAFLIPVRYHSNYVITSPWF
ncbi:hypothetical protein [Bacillus sp. 03113]|uniref:hypothetical protein n=1 Tax=Bacillus sp. 03113 TaxID=2578211 RepID=UPI0011448475|nr:hypothetical protein [Bacillus sp. 03113]